MLSVISHLYGRPVLRICNIFVRHNFSHSTCIWIRDPLRYSARRTSPISRARLWRNSEKPSSHPSHPIPRPFVASWKSHRSTVPVSLSSFDRFRDSLILRYYIQNHETIVALYSLNCSPIKYFLNILSFPFLSNIARVAFLSLQWKYASLHGAVPALK